MEDYLAHYAHEVEKDEEFCSCVDSNLFVNISLHQCPVVFHPDYDISFFGLEKLHPFDASKWGKVFSFLEEWGLLHRSSICIPTEATERDLLIAHSQRYLDSLRSSLVYARIFEIPCLCAIPYCVTNKYLLRKMRLHVGGTVAACRLALERNWAVNIGGGFHHASRDKGMGFCVYADISLAVRILLRLKLVRKVLILDVDAHQGNGYEHDFLDDGRVFIVDLFNPSIFPRDKEAYHAISRSVGVKAKTTDENYVNLVRSNLEAGLGEFAADLIIYNAGTDSLEGDPLGGLSLSAEGIVARDEAAFDVARDHATPIAMLTSGGYQRSNARVIADSLKNLHEKGFIQLKGAPPQTKK